ncbi:MAG: hypothetical protein ACJAV1_002797 [Paraglaciecola sp.]|jgi:hypothetical protein
MDKFKEAAFIIKELNNFKNDITDAPYFITKVCAYFDKIKNEDLTKSDLKFLKYISNAAGIPHYYDLLISKFGKSDDIDDYDLNTLSACIYESTLHIDENIKIHRYQKEVLDKFIPNEQNRYFLSATTSFGKTFLIYEIVRKLQYNNIVLIFPTIALLSENYERLILDSNYEYFKDQFSIHTLSDTSELGDKNIFVFTPERYLSFIDNQPDIELGFVFVDEIYKIDNEYLIDSINKENERDTAYRIALQSILIKSQDILLVGPYIEFPDKTDYSLNQSFNTFLNINEFVVIDYNKYEIVNKSSTIIKNRNYSVDDNLAITLKGYSGKKKAEQISKVVFDIRVIGENAILYSKGPGMSEGYARSIIEFSFGEPPEISSELSMFISHLVTNFKYDDWVVIKSLKHKIGIHHGLVPKYIQKEIINFFNNGDLDVLVSTTTITEGVNTSAKNLLVLNATKGSKPLKTFDAKNIAGRAGRFLHHYSGRVLIFDKKFKEIMDGTDSEIKHKNFDPDSIKDEIDYFITGEDFLNEDDLNNKKKVIEKQEEREIPDEVMAMYKVISHSDKITIFDSITILSFRERQMVKQLINMINRGLKIDYDGFKVLLKIIKPIVTNSNLLFLIENESPVKNGKNTGKKYSTLIYILSAYLTDGFSGSVKYNMTRKNSDGSNYNVDQAIRDTSKFVYNTLKYQLVKYLGVFNLMYKYYESSITDIEMEDIIGIDRLLLKLEYNAMSEKGRLASDYGVPHRIVEYYDDGESKTLKRQFDKFELTKFKLIESIFNSRAYPDTHK